MRRTALILLVSLLLGAWATAATAGDPPVPIEGKLLVSGLEEPTWPNPLGNPFAYFMEGSSDNIIPAALPFSDGNISPLGNQVAYDEYYIEEFPWDFSVDVWRANTDGSGVANLSEAAGLAGINCIPYWSPDGSQILFQHCDPEEGLWPCDAGFHIWVMDSDGSNAHRVTTPGGPRTEQGCWSPNGYRILCHSRDAGAITIDTDGMDMEVIPNVGGAVAWSPDGAHIASSWPESGIVDGEPGVWRQLRLTNADGSNPQTLVQQFVRDCDVETHSQMYGDCSTWWIGPVYPKWSPRGDRIAFLAAMPFDPVGPYYKSQDEVWVYDLGADDLTKITDDVSHDNWLSWNGYNTFPEDPEVTVDNTTVTFSEVTDDGLTTILRDDDPPELPGGYQFCGEYYEVSTTATVGGPITICMTYEDEDVPGGNEEALCLLHYDEAIPGYEDITISRDPVNNIVCGQVDSLSVFGLAAMPVFGGFRPPINPDGSSVWKAGRTIPVKFALSDWEGTAITNATCHLACLPWVGESVGAVSESAEATSADAGDTFRYCPEEQQYIYNFSTKGMEPGAYLLEVTAEGWPGFKATVKIGLR